VEEVKIMNKKILGVFVAILAVVILALPMSAVFAENDKNSKFIPVSGGATYVPSGPGSGTKVESRNAGRNFIWAKTGSDAAWTGDIATNDATCDWCIIFFNYVPPLSYERLVTQLTWTLINPAIAGDPYEGELIISGMGNGKESGNWRIISGTEELANIHGQGTWQGAGPGGVAYEGYVHFDP
jgi:hypothetical protein